MNCKTVHTTQSLIYLVLAIRGEVNQSQGTNVISSYLKMGKQQVKTYIDIVFDLVHIKLHEILPQPRFDIVALPKLSAMTGLLQGW